MYKKILNNTQLMFKLYTILIYNDLMTIYQNGIFEKSFCDKLLYTLLKVKGAKIYLKKYNKINFLLHYKSYRYCVSKTHNHPHTCLLDALYG